MSSVFRVSTSPISRSWRAARSISSHSMPLTSRRRSTARPATARPSASSGRPALVVSVMTKPRPSRRKVSTACSMRCAAAGSSQAPKASTRSGSEPDTTMPVSPMISGSSVPAGQATSTCGCDNSSVLSRSISARSTMASSCAADCAKAADLRVRTRTTMASTAKQSRPSVVVAAATWSWLTVAAAPVKRSMRPVPACAGVPQDVARTKAARNPPRLGRARSLSFAVRIVAGISDLAPGMRTASAAPRANRKTLPPWGLAPKESRP